MVLAHIQSSPKTICVIAIICSSLVLSYISFVNLPKSFAQTSVRFTTIYPGWYQGRTIHIHDKVRSFNGLEKTMEWTSQIYFDNSINQQVHTELPYSNHGPPQTSNEEDGIYTGPSTDGLMQRNSGEELMVHLIKEGHSFLGTFNIVLNSGQPEQ